MNQKTLENELRQKTGQPKAVVQAVLNAFTETVRENVKAGHDVRLAGIGIFSRVKRKARTRRNPQTGGSVPVPAHYVPKLRASSDFKELVK
jgi:DNA-binding protein HU-beta